MTEIPVSMTERPTSTNRLRTAVARALADDVAAWAPGYEGGSQLPGVDLDAIANAALVAAGVPALLDALAEWRALPMDRNEHGSVWLGPEDRRAPDT